MDMNTIYKKEIVICVKKNICVLKAKILSILFVNVFCFENFYVFFLSFFFRMVFCSFEVVDRVQIGANFMQRHEIPDVFAAFDNGMNCSE